jgi:hypothetical protein
MSMSPARQPFHIFRKDAIHLWPETLLSIALLIGFCWAESQTWLPSDGSFNIAGLVAPIIKFLLVISWLVLTSRLVHDEELVGDRQFWTTRPYTWYSLLGAKLLYLAVFVCLPFVLMQAWLLHHAGLYPTHLVPALLKSVLIIAAIVLLPLLAIAAVTATFVRYISSVIGGFIYFMVIIVIAAYNWSDSLDAPNLGYILSGTLLALILFALVFMYWQRKTAIARIILAAVPLVVILFGLIAPLNLLTGNRYPDTTVGTSTFDADPTRQQAPGPVLIRQKKVLVVLPVDLKLNTLPDKNFIELQRARVTIDGPEGFHYVSDWTSDQGTFFPQKTSYGIPLPLPQSVFDKIHNQPVKMHIELGTQTFHPGTPYSIDATEKPFPLPGNASCTLSAETSEIDCRYPFHKESMTQVSATIHNGDCQAPGPLSATVYGTQTASASIPFGFTPVEFDHTALSVGQNKAPLCPGTRTTFTTAEEGAYGRIHLDIPSITLDAYALRVPVREDRRPPAQ